MFPNPHRKVVFADISAYHEAADDALAHICEKVEEVSEALDIPGFDLKESVSFLQDNSQKTREVCLKSIWERMVVM